MRKHSSAALTQSLPSTVTESWGWGWNFPGPGVSWDSEFIFGTLTHVLNYLISNVGFQVIDNVKVEPSKGHGPHHLSLNFRCQ